VQSDSSSKVEQPLYGPDVKLPEITFRAIVISILLAIILAASNAYLALKIGTTISASIPASIFAIAILRMFKDSNVLESNIIQTAASAGEGIAAATAFVLPAMIILRVWSGFPFLETAMIVLVGGLLGVLFSIPLRRVMLSLPALKFPEGTAIGNVLKISAKGGNHIKLLGWGGGVGGLVSLCQSGFQVFSDNLQLWTVSGTTIIGCGFGFSSASLAAGYIIGVEVGISLLVGLIIGWMMVLPWLGWTMGIPHGVPVYHTVMNLWSNHMRYVGVGTMLVGGVWTLLRLLKPVGKGLKASFKGLSSSSSQGMGKLLRTERDISIKWVLGGTVLLVIALYFLLAHVLHEVHIDHGTDYIQMAILVTLVAVVVLGFVVAMICAYFTGLIGSTNNPLSGIVIIVVLIFSAIYLLFFGAHGKSHMMHVASAVILVSFVVATIGSISNENLQDLKAGQMVGATPWKQQVMLALGVVVSAFVVGPILDLLFHAYGMAGVFPHPGMDPSRMLAAPQAGLMAAVAKGVLTHNLQWNMVGIGGGIAVVIICIDTWTRKHLNFALPSLAVGLGIYLPPEVIMPIIIGGIVSALVKKKLKARNGGCSLAAEDHHQRGILLSCGMVAGSAIMGVLMAIPFVIKGSSDALALVSSSFLPIANVLGVLVFIALCVYIYRIGISKDAT
jgi:putative OPT family oligopeptide transporter